MSVQYTDGTFSETMPELDAIEEFNRANEQGTARALVVGSESEVNQFKKDADLKGRLNDLEKRMKEVEAGPVQSEHVVIPTTDEIRQVLRSEN